MSKIVGKLRSSTGDSVVLKVVEESDSICAPCPFRRGKKCEKQSKIRKLDDGYLKALGLKAGDEISWGEAKLLIAKKISLDIFHDVCSICEWKSLGLCEQGLNDLKASLTTMAET
jgi:hypothetical protein